MRLLLPAVVLVVLGACGYRPPAQTDTSKPAYEADLDACGDSAASAVNRRSAKTGMAWFSSPVRRWGQIQDEVQTCMAGKGYGRVRWCTEEEMRTGSRSGTVVVTSAGVQCSEPPAPERRRAG
jgi:hypothetical protein